MGSRKWDKLLRDLNTDGKPVMHYMGNQANAQNTVAWCMSRSHKGAMSPKMLKQHKCLEKNCSKLKINKENEYWNQKKKIKTKKKEASIIKRNTQGTKVQKTGSGGFVKRNLYTKELSNVNELFSEMTLYHLWGFNTCEDIVYIGGFYSFEVTATQMLNSQKKYFITAIVDNESWVYEGYRINSLGGISKIDLAWGNDYWKLLLNASCDLAVKLKYHLL